MAQQRELLQITWLSQTEAGRTQRGGGSGYWAKDRVKRRTALRLETCAKVWRSPMVLQGGVRSRIRGRAAPSGCRGASRCGAALRCSRVAQPSPGAPCGCSGWRRGLETCAEVCCASGAEDRAGKAAGAVLVLY